MAITKPTDVLGAVAQLQYLNRKGAFAVPMRMKWLPSSLKEATLPEDVRRAYEPLQKVLQIDLRRISDGAEVPADADRLLSQLDRFVVLLRFSPDAWKSQLAEDILKPLLEETSEGQATGEAAQAGQLPCEFEGPTWLKLYRVVLENEGQASGRAGAMFELLDKLAGPVDRGNELAIFTLLTRCCGFDQMEQLVTKMGKVESEQPGSWNWLFADETLQALIAELDGDQLRDAIVATILIVGEAHHIEEQRAKLVSECFARRRSGTAFVEAIRQLARLQVSHGLAPAILRLLADRPADLELVIGCLVTDEGAVSRDAQHVIGQILGRWPVAEKKVFRRFCGRIANLELSSSLRQAWDERVGGNGPLTQSIIEHKCDEGKLIKRLREGKDQLFWLLLLALQRHEGASLGDVTRGLSLISLAISQNKIDSRHLDLLMNDFRAFPIEALESLADESRVDSRTRIDKELSLLYFTLRIISQTAERIDGLDLDHLSTTLRKLRVRERRE